MSTFDIGSPVWKQMAKNLRKDFYIAQGSFLDAMKLLREAEADATRRKELLRRWNDKRVQETHEDCYFCGASVQVETTLPPKTIIVFTDNHTADCELAEELGDEN